MPAHDTTSRGTSLRDGVGLPVGSTSPPRVPARTRWGSGRTSAGAERV